MTKRYKVEVSLTRQDVDRLKLRVSRPWSYTIGVSAINTHFAIDKIRELGYHGTIQSIEEVDHADTATH